MCSSDLLKENVAETTTNVTRLQNRTMRENNNYDVFNSGKGRSNFKQIDYIQSMLQTIANILFLEPHYQFLRECFYYFFLQDTDGKRNPGQFRGVSWEKPSPLSQRVEPPMGGLFEEFLPLCLGDTLGSTSVLIWLSPVTLIKHSLGDSPWSCLKAATDPFIIV